LVKVCEKSTSSIAALSDLGADHGVSFTSPGLAEGVLNDEVITIERLTIPNHKHSVIEIVFGELRGAQILSLDNTVGIILENQVASSDGCNDWAILKSFPQSLRVS